MEHEEGLPQLDAAAPLLQCARRRMPLTDQFVSSMICTVNVLSLALILQRPLYLLTMD